MSENSENIERTAAYFENFNRKKVLKNLVASESPTIFDVGANEGNTIAEFKEWWPQSIIHAFEPQQECWEQLEQISLNDSSIRINKYALGNEDVDSVPFYSHDLTTGQSGFIKVNLKSEDSLNLNKIKKESESALNRYHESLNHERKVDLRRLDSYLRDENLSEIDLLKLDTQGFEPEILEGAGKALSGIKVVITELMFYDFYERSLSFYDIEKFLLPAGFKLFDISHISKNPLNGRTDWVDIIYVKR